MAPGAVPYRLCRFDSWFPENENSRAQSLGANSAFALSLQSSLRVRTTERTPTAVDLLISSTTPSLFVRFDAGKEPSGRLTQGSALPALKGMEIHLTAEQGAQLSREASHEGKPIEQLLTECAAYLLRDNDRFLREVEEGIAAAERGEFVGEEEMNARVTAMLES